MKPKWNELYQALKDLDQLTELESPVVEEIGERERERE